MTTHWYDVTDESLRKLNERNDLIIIDIREPEEYAEEYILGSTNVPVSQFDSTDWSHFRGKSVMMLCRAGRRTKMNQDLLAAKGMREIYCLAGGINQWKAMGLPTATRDTQHCGTGACGNGACAPRKNISLVRQVQMAFAALVLMAIGLEYALPQWGHIPTLVVAIGTFLAGLSGRCLVIKILKSMPWNQA